MKLEISTESIMHETLDRYMKALRDYDYDTLFSMEYLTSSDDEIDSMIKSTKSIRAQYVDDGKEAFFEESEIVATEIVNGLLTATIGVPICINKANESKYFVIEKQVVVFGTGVLSSDNHLKILRSNLLPDLQIYKLYQR